MKHTNILVSALVGVLVFTLMITGLTLANTRDTIVAVFGGFLTLAAAYGGFAYFAHDLIKPAKARATEFLNDRNGRIDGFVATLGGGAALILAVLFALYAWVGGTSVKTGFVGVRVNEMGSNAGVVDQELGVGWYFPQWASHVLRFPTTTQTEVWSDAENADHRIGPAIRFRNADGVDTAIAVSMQVHIDPTKASNAVQRYRLGFQEMIRGPVQRDLQDAFVQHGLNYSSDDLIRHGASELLARVRATLTERLAAEGIVIDSLNQVGAPGLPQAIVDRINERIEAEQNAETQLQQVRVFEARAAQVVAEARGTADAERERARGRADAIAMEGAAIRANPQIIELRVAERQRGICPPQADVCAPGASIVGAVAQ